MKQHVLQCILGNVSNLSMRSNDNSVIPAFVLRLWGAACWHWEENERFTAGSSQAESFRMIATKRMKTFIFIQLYNPIFGDQLHLHHQGDVKWFCTQLQRHPDDDDDGDGVGLRKVGFYNSPETALCPRRIHCVLSPW